MNKTDLDLKVLDGRLVVRGEKFIERERAEGRYHVAECAYGCFRAVLALARMVAIGMEMAFIIASQFSNYAMWR